MTALDTKALLEGVTPGDWTTEATGERHPRFGIFTKGNVILARVWMKEDAALIAVSPRPKHPPHQRIIHDLRVR